MKLKIILFFLINSFLLYSQEDINLGFEKSSYSKIDSNFTNDDYQYCDLDLDLLKSIIKDDINVINLSIPFKNSKFEIRLVENKIYPYEYEVQTSSKQIIGRQTIKSYLGYIVGDIKSQVYITISDNQLAGVIFTEYGNINIGKINETSINNLYIIYNDKNLKIENPFHCFTAEDKEIDTSNMNTNIQKIKGNKLLSVDKCKSIGVYFEVQYQTYQSLGSINNVLFYLNNVFNSVNGLFANEGVSLFISKVFIWDTPDPYSYLKNTRLIEFRNLRSVNDFGYRGRIGHLLGSNDQGGIAFLGSNLCNSYNNAEAAVSDVIPFFHNNPKYSWDIYVISHELGHNLGSNHTQWCGWPGGPIDNCESPEGGCNPGPSPGYNGGTIMSYCQNNWGINFLNGFGNYPGNAIRNHVNSFSCLEIQEETFIQNFIFGGGKFYREAAIKITAGKNVTSGTIGNVIVRYQTPTIYADVEFRSGKEIQLKDGFIAEAGSKFRAYIDTYINCSEITSPKTSTDIQSILQNNTNFTLSPNPADESIRVSYQITGSGKLYLRSSLGVDLIPSISLDNAQGIENIDISKFPVGIYLISIESDSGIHTDKFVISR